MSVLLTTAGIVYLYSLESFYVKEVQKSKTQRQEVKPQKVHKRQKEILVNCSSPEIGNDRLLTNTKHKDLRTQSNVFNKLNNDLYYNELGEQFNIQGIDINVNGYDQSIYL